jgi:hypothetical protein
MGPSREEIDFSRALYDEVSAMILKNLDLMREKGVENRTAYAVMAFSLCHNLVALVVGTVEEKSVLGELHRMIDEAYSNIQEAKLN